MKLNREQKEMLKNFWWALLPSIVFAILVGHEWWIG